jgi:hypothetical protein
MYTWYFLTMREVDIRALSFDVYNTSGSTELASVEVSEGVGQILGSHAQVLERRRCEMQAEGLMEVIDALPGKRMSKDEYLQHINSYPSLLLPFLQLQKHLRQYIFGEQYWQRLEAAACTKKEDPLVKMLLASVRASMGVPHNGHKRKSVDATETLARVEDEYNQLMHTTADRVAKQRERRQSATKPKDAAQTGQKSRESTLNNDNATLQTIEEPAAP